MRNKGIVLTISGIGLAAIETGLLVFSSDNEHLGYMSLVGKSFFY
jgi:hypothetical protein